MIVLKSTDTLQIVLAGAVTTTQADLYASYIDAMQGVSLANQANRCDGSQSGVSAGTTPVTLVSSPIAKTLREVQYLSIYNADTVSMTVTLKLIDNGTARILGKVTLGMGERAEYTDSNGFRTVTATGTTSSGAAWGGITGTLSAQADLSAALALLQPITPRTQSVSSSATVTPTFANDLVDISAQATGLTLANPTGTAIDGFGMVIRIKDNGTARAISFGTQYRAVNVTLPTTTVISKMTYLGLIFNNAATKWDVVSVAQE